MAHSDDQSLSRLEKFKKFYSPPYTVICEASFVHHVETKVKKSLPAVLESLLEGQVDILSTLCISFEVKSLFNAEIGHHRHATVKECGHSKADHLYVSLNCLKSFIQNNPFRKLVVCAMKGSIETNDLMVRGRILITPDGHRGVKVAFVAPIDSSENLYMDDFRKFFGFRPPFPVVCEQEFLNYLLEHAQNVNDALEFLLGGEVNVLSIQSAGADMRSFVRNFPARLLVVCTLNDGRNLNQVLGRIIVVPDRKGSLRIDTIAGESLGQHANWLEKVKGAHSYLYKRLRLGLLAERILNPSSRGLRKPVEKRMKILLVTRDGEESEFTFPYEVVQKIISLSAMEPSASEADDQLDLQFELFTREGDNPKFDMYPVTILLKKVRIPARISFTGASGSAQPDLQALPSIDPEYFPMHTPDLQAEGLAMHQAQGVRYNEESKELILQIHEQLQALGLSTTASVLLKEAQLTPSLAAPSSLAYQTSGPGSSSVQIQWPSGRSSCGFLALENSKQEELSEKHDSSVSSKRQPLVISSSVGVQSKMPSYFQENPFSPSSSRALNFLKRKLTESRDGGGSPPRKRLNTSDQGFRSPTYKEEEESATVEEIIASLPLDLQEEALAQQQEYNEEARRAGAAERYASASLNTRAKKMKKEETAGSVNAGVTVDPIREAAAKKKRKKKKKEKRKNRDPEVTNSKDKKKA